MGNRLSDSIFGTAMPRDMPNSSRPHQKSVFARLGDFFAFIYIHESFKAKIIISVTTILVTFVIILLYLVHKNFSSYSNNVINEKVNTNISTLKRYIHEAENYTTMSAINMAGNPEIVKAVKKRDIKEIKQLLFLYGGQQINFCEICDNKGIVIARTYNDVSGDSIIEQHHIANALANGSEATTGFDSENFVRIAVRTGAPIRDTNGSIIGVVSTGFRFDVNETLDDIKSILKADINVWFKGENIATTLEHDGKRAIGIKFDPRVEEIVMKDGKEYNGELSILNLKRRFFCMPISNVKGEIFAAISIGNPLDELRTASRDLVSSIFFITSLLLVVTASLISLAISILMKSIITLSKDMNEVACGNLNIEINVESNDEVGNLAKSINSVTKIIKKLMEDINLMIAEHSRGNPDYIIDTRNLQGDYKILADNISELANVGMKDRLTGIPNRHTFDNRLELEWNRAMRNRSPISALMMDLDKFKNYNDAFGHQQGDLALQAVSQVFMRSVKRKLDFVARWGGEEFVVLLPDTDALGAMSVAEYIRTEIENMSIPCTDERAARITVSIGISTQIPTHLTSPDYLISKADEALYKAKQTGRNKVVSS